MLVMLQALAQLNLIVKFSLDLLEFSQNIRDAVLSRTHVIVFTDVGLVTFSDR